MIPPTSPPTQRRANFSSQSEAIINNAFSKLGAIKTSLKRVDVNPTQAVLLLTEVLFDAIVQNLLSNNQQDIFYANPNASQALADSFFSSEGSRQKAEELLAYFEEHGRLPD